MLDARSELLFTELIHGRQHLNSQFFKDKYKWSRSQMNYSLKNINSWLLEQNYQPITRNRNGYFQIDKDIRDVFMKNRISQPESRGYFTSQQRRLLMALILLMSNDYLSTYYFTDYFWVSKNTVLRDLGRIKKQWQTGGLNLEYSREDGYYVFGSEWSKRNYLLGLVNVLVNERKDISFVKNICQLDPKTIQAAQHILEELEYDLNIQFSDDQISLLTYFIPIICKRIQRGEGIDYLYEKTSFQEKLSKPQSFLKRTKVFGAFELSDEEERYFTLLILSANRRKSSPLEPALYHKIEQAILEIIDKIADFLTIEIDRKEELLDKLMSHMESAYYRIKFHLTLITKDKHLSEVQHFPIYYLMKDFIEPLEDLLGEEIPNDEIFFLSIFVGSHLQSLNQSSIKKIKKALIVCQNGIFISNYYKNVLTAIFSEILFVNTISMREVNTCNYDVDYYFSTEVIYDSQKPVFLLRNLLSTLAEKQRFRQYVLEETKNFGEEKYALGKMTDLLRHFEDKNQAKRVLSEIFEMVNENRPQIFNQSDSIFSNIKDMPIQIFQNETWQEVVQSLGNILIKKKLIVQSYIDEVLKQYVKISPQIALRENIALPHVGSEFGVYGTGLALGIVKEGIFFKENQPIHLVILFASNTKEAIADTMLELVNLSGQKEVIDRLKESRSVLEAREILKGYFIKV